MTQEEYNEAAALVRLRKELEHTNQHLVAHIDALTKSNAQCGEYLRQNEQLRSELVEVRAALAATTEQRDSLRRTIAEWERADTKPHERVTADDVADHVVPPIMNPVSAAVADYQDLLKRTAEAGMACSCSTHPHPPCSYCQPLNDGYPEPDPANDPKDAALEFRNVVPTPEMIALVGYWDLISGNASIAFKPGGLRPASWRIAGSREWMNDPCPQPLKPHGMTWQQLDNALANQQPVPMCMTCHHCGNALDASVFGPYNVCTTIGCPRTVTNNDDGLDKNPYDGPCHAGILVRHE